MSYPALVEMIDFAWFISDFVRRVPEVAHAVVVSADGLLLAGSHALPSDRAEQVSSVACGLVSLAKAPRGASTTATWCRRSWR